MIDNLFTKHNEINQNKTEMKLNHFGSIRLLKKIGCFLSDTIYTTTGILLTNESSTGNKLELNTFLDNGIYIVRAYNLNGFAVTEKVLIMN